jgi:hypothetical protein
MTQRGRGIREVLPPLPQLNDQSEAETDLGGVIPLSLKDALAEIQTKFEDGGFVTEYHQQNESFEAIVWAKLDTRVLVSAARMPGSKSQTSVVFRLIDLSQFNTRPVIGELP